jgi:hypothetical protein
MPDEAPKSRSLPEMPGVLRNRRDSMSEIKKLRDAAVARQFPEAETLRTSGSDIPEDVLKKMQEEGLTPAPSIAPSPLGPEEDEGGPTRLPDLNIQGTPRK